MEIRIKCNAQEFAAFVLALQKRQGIVDSPIDTITKAVVNTVNHMAKDSGKHTLRV